MTITPGPWKYNDGNLPDADHKEYGFSPIYAEVECTCIPKHRRPRRYIPFSKEDVRLIAAAPQLLEACKDLIYYIDILLKERYEMGLPEDHLEFIPEPISKALIAIAAAEGKP